MDIISNHPDMPWDGWWISKNPNITMDFINKNLNLEWDWEMIFPPNIWWFLY